MHIRLKYIGTVTIKIAVIQKLDGTPIKGGEKATIYKGDIFQVREIDGLNLVNVYSNKFISIAKEDLKKESIIQSVEAFKKYLERKQKTISSKASLSAIKILSTELARVFKHIEKYINEFGSRKQTLTVSGEEVEVDLYLVSIQETENTRLLGQAIQECLVDINMVLGIVESFSIEEFNGMFSKKQKVSKPLCGTVLGKTLCISNSKVVSVPSHIKKAPEKYCLEAGDKAGFHFMLTVFGLLLVAGLIFLFTIS